MTYSSREERAAWQRQYRKRNRDALRAYERQRYRVSDRAAYSRQWRAANPDRVWANTLRDAHGMRPSQWHDLWDQQACRCYLCEDPLSEDRKYIHVDHDHSCCGPSRSCWRCWRGLACNRCNVAVGMLGDDPERMRRVACNFERAQARLANRPAAPEQMKLPLGDEAA